MEQRTPVRPPSEAARPFTSKNAKKRPRLHAVLRNKFGTKTIRAVRYFFGGVLAGAAGLVVVGLTGLAGVLPAAGAGTPD